MANDLSFLDSTDDVQNIPLLKERMDIEGYLYFRRLVDPIRAIQVKKDILDILHSHFLIEEEHKEEPLWSGGPQPTESEWMAVYDRIVRLESFLELAESVEIIAVLEAVCGEAIKVFNQKLVRLVYPDKEVAGGAAGIGAHQDGDPTLGYQSKQFYTCWVSLMNIDQAIGGLAIVPRSHKIGYLNAAETGGLNQPGARGSTYGLDVSSLEWASGEFEPGSAMIFSCSTVHRGLPNNSDRLRISVDFRYQAATEKLGYLGSNLGPDVRRTAQKIDEILSSRAMYVTTRATPEILNEVRQKMLEKGETTMERAQELVLEIKKRNS